MRSGQRTDLTDQNRVFVGLDAAARPRLPERNDREPFALARDTAALIMFVGRLLLTPGEDGEEAEDAISSVIDGGPPVQLAPQVSRIRQVQHQLAERYALASRSRGREPHRRVEISRDGAG